MIYTIFLKWVLCPYLKNGLDFNVQLLFDILSHAEILALYLQPYFHLNVKVGTVPPPPHPRTVHLVFYFFFQTKYGTHIIFAKRNILTFW